MKIAYVTTYDPSDRAHWSGLGHAIMKALVDAGASVEALGPLSTDLRCVGRLKGAFYRRVLRLGYEYDRERIACLGYARQLTAKLAKGQHDIVLSPGAIPVSRLDCAQPIAIWADATFACYVEHYGLRARLARETLRAGEATERAAFARAALLTFSSQWAADSALRDYGADPAKIQVIPFGANFLVAPTREEALRRAAGRPADRCELISIGVDWVRKDMPRAIALARALNARGLPDTPDDRRRAAAPGREAAGLRRARRLHRQAHAGWRGALLSRSHFHVLFSTADATPVVLSEANAWAAPNIASDVGGVSTVVVDSRGGRRFAPKPDIRVVAECVLSYVTDCSSCRQLSEQARNTTTG